MSKILVVDDEKTLRLLYKRDLEQEGHSVVVAQDAGEGMRTLETEFAERVVLDIRMPGIDGLDAMGRILERHPQVPIVLNTAYSSYKENFLSWSADAYVIKSSDTGELRAKVKELLAARREPVH